MVVSLENVDKLEVPLGGSASCESQPSSLPLERKTTFFFMILYVGDTPQGLKPRSFSLPRIVSFQSMCSVATAQAERVVAE